ncbi:xanthine dehydrogenase family protein subunit M [Hyphomicrobiales bacterium]|jgi:carbon-monoxide dehydrogenase medium subunit|nr:xanthine dehydrogenase family protein subunit M [Rhodobiaceae bacterium]MBT6223178.1 xanthine dehydrogenase family protein subunit M [Rhodobiaceae bacterium]MDB4831898.1 xanthine dehydrogenase family protein subunit M [Hyphomicrobiales bacterium]MDC0139284.1 xanthine dehydrogenase family protein subunit M [Hyphomicrobiales bacterium]MDC3272671.1 xanthine dehydrogenase family protein subunit M [Hyphomicrobiales bacterium]|tara:strand:- start:159 stop:962 length:804 start_codon:yes stop_codon:yes gene_type:complete
MYDFNYHKPKTIEQAVELMNSCDDPKIISGGHTMVPTLKQRLAQPSDIVDISNVSGISNISLEDNDSRINIGSLSSHYDVSNSDVVIQKIPSLAYLASQIGDPQVRYRGTLGGSVANADPAADYPAALLALNATIVTNMARYQAEDFFVDMFQTPLADSEIITNILFDIPVTGAYVKFRNPASGYAMVGVFLAKYSNSIVVSVTGAGPKAFRLSEAEELLTKSFDVNSLNELRIESNGLNSDIHASSEYRAHLIKTSLQDAVRIALK